MNEQNAASPEESILNMVRTVRFKYCCEVFQPWVLLRVLSIWMLSDLGTGQSGLKLSVHETVLCKVRNDVHSVKRKLLYVVQIVQVECTLRSAAMIRLWICESRAALLGFLKRSVGTYGLVWKCCFLVASHELNSLTQDLDLLCKTLAISCTIGVRGQISLANLPKTVSVNLLALNLKSVER